MCLILSVIMSIAAIAIVLKAPDGQTYEGCSLVLVDLLKVLVVVTIAALLCVLFTP